MTTSDPFSANILKHILSPKLVDNGVGGFDAKVDIKNVDSITVSGDIIGPNGLYSKKWVGEIASMFTTIVTSGGSFQSEVNISSLSKSNRFLVTLSPTNTTLKNKSLSTIIHYTMSSDIFGGGSLFIDSNNYITISSHSTVTNIVLVNIVSNSATQETFELTFRQILM